MIDQLFTPHQAASQLAISPATVRRWCADHAVYLSPGANPDKGVFRRLSPADIEVLHEVKKYRSEGLSPGAINERLAGVVFPTPTDIQPATPTQQGATPGADALMLVDTLKSIQTRLEALEQERHAQRLRVDTAYLVAAGFIAGLILGLAVWWFQ